MKKKINQLFKYRKLPLLLSSLGKKDKQFLEKRLVEIQKSIYKLDAYLEKKWKTNDEKLEALWKNINSEIRKTGFNDEEIENLTKHIKKYQLHELQLRENKLPTRLKLEYFYYYKSCDVRLMREIIYCFDNEIESKLKLSDWRYYDLVTEINDDVEDVFEDQTTINGNCFLISIIEDGISVTKDKFLKFLDNLLESSIIKFGDTKSFEHLYIHYQTMKRIVETKQLIHKNLKIIGEEDLKNVRLYNFLKKK